MFCANCQAETEQVVSIQDSTGEIIYECPCGRTLKFAPNTTKEELEAYEAAHAEANKGQISMEALHKAQAAKLAEILPGAENA